MEISTMREAVKVLRIHRNLQQQLDQARSTPSALIAHRSSLFPHHFVPPLVVGSQSIP